MRAFVRALVRACVSTCVSACVHTSIRLFVLMRASRCICHSSDKSLTPRRAEFLKCCGEHNPVSCNAPDNDELISTVSNGYGR